MTQRTPRAPTFIVPLGAVVRAVLLVLACVAVLGLIASGVLGRVAGGITLADSASVAAQQGVAVRNIQRGYAQATDQVRKAHALKLAISAQQADAIATKALTDLATLRHSALLSLVQTTGTVADGESFARSTEQTLDAASAQPEPSPTPVLLAPRLYAIVSRFDQLATSISDKATTDLTQSPTPAPSGSPRPTPTR